MMTWIFITIMVATWLIVSLFALRLANDDQVEKLQKRAVAAENALRAYLDNVVRSAEKLGLAEQALEAACAKIVSCGHCVSPPHRVYDDDSETYVTEDYCEYDRDNDCAGCWKHHFKQKAAVELRELEGGAE